MTGCSCSDPNEMTHFDPLLCPITAAHRTGSLWKHSEFPLLVNILQFQSESLLIANRI